MNPLQPLVSLLASYPGLTTPHPRAEQTHLSFFGSSSEGLELGCVVDIAHSLSYPDSSLTLQIPLTLAPDEVLWRSGEDVRSPWGWHWPQTIGNLCC